MLWIDSNALKLGLNTYSEEVITWLKEAFSDEEKKLDEFLDDSLYTVNPEYLPWHVIKPVFGLKDEA